MAKSLRSSGCSIAICTGKDPYQTTDILKYYGIEDYFDVLVCADDVLYPKPSPEPILKALDVFGCSADGAIVIADGYSDICSANAAGVKSILTLWYGDNGVPQESDYTVSTVE